MKPIDKKVMEYLMADGPSEKVLNSLFEKKDYGSSFTEENIAKREEDIEEGRWTMADDESSHVDEVIWF